MLRVHSSESETHLVDPGPYEHAEGVIWDERREELWWVNISAGELYRRGSFNQGIDRWGFDEALGFVAFCEEPGLLILGLASRLALFNCADGNLSHLVHIPHEVRGLRVNDGRCDRHGNLVFGSMSADGKGTNGRIWRYSAVHDQLRALDLPPVAIPNSICFSPDGKFLYYADSALRTIWVCDYDPESGTASSRRPFVECGAVPWVPDGSCIDSDGGLWNARWGGASIARYDAMGRADCVIDCLAHQPSCVCFGARNLDSLFVSSASLGIESSELWRRDGSLWSWRVEGVRGMPEARFRNAVG